MVHLDYRDARPIYSQIADDFRHQIRTGILQKEDRLPSVRELASQLAINPNTIQRAYRELELQGWIATVPGKGCFVTGSTGTDSRQEQSLLQRFDTLVQALEAEGITKNMLITRLGGNNNASDA